ncbi:MAG: hypothetical protein R3F34_06800 [Planctomycetota bacterium]
MSRLLITSVTALACALAAPTAHADGREPGSVLVYPIHRSDLGNPTWFNVVSVTNTNRAGGGETDVHFQYVNVKKVASTFFFASCTVEDRVETLSPADTFSVLTSCHNGASASNGYLVVSAMDPELVDTHWSFNHLVGSEQIVSAFGGIYALNAIPFISTLVEGEDTDVDGDGRLDFDGIEYEGVPDELFIDSFIGGLGDSIALLSFTGGEYLTNVDFVIYNDDEIQLSTQFSFSCWAHVPLATISGYFTAQGLATTVDDPTELDLDCDGVQELDTGWAIVRPQSAISVTSPTIMNPAVLGALTNDLGLFMNARLLWETPTKQFNAQFPN